MSEVDEKRQKTEMGEVRKWEDMEYDCLVNILGRVGKVSLLLDVPFVCNSWYKASLNPLLWKQIDCTEFSNYPKRKLGRFANGNRISKFSFPGLIELMVSRGQGLTTSLVLSSHCGQKDLEYVAEKCPELKSLTLHWKHRGCPDGEIAVRKWIPKWKKLEELSFAAHFEELFPKVVEQIGENCENFKSLVVNAGGLYYGDSSAIATHLPKIKKLSLCYCEAEGLKVIVLACKELEVLEVHSCDYGDDWNEEKVKELTSHIKTVKVVAHDPDDYVFHDYSDISSPDDSDYTDYILDYYSLL